jgi:hypothetical protein
MTYGHRVFAALFAFFALVLVANGYLIRVAGEWASDDMHVGKGYSKFPPQLITASPAAGAAR